MSASMNASTSASPLPAAFVHTARYPTTPEDPFSAYNFASSSTRESRHDRRISAELPPAYTVSEAMPPPSYSIKDEPATLAMYLFKFGFLFPPFWIMGVIILFSPLRAPPTSDATEGWLPDKTDAEKQVVIDRIRRAEMKWARRCLVASIAFILLALVAALSIWAVLRA